MPAVGMACVNTGTPPTDTDAVVIKDGTAVVHDGAHAGLTAWSFCWTAPKSGTGTITAFVAEVDGNGGDGTMSFPEDTIGDDVFAGAVPIAEKGATTPATARGGCDAGGPGLLGVALVLALLIRRKRLALVLLVGLSACTHVRATQRETLARRNMKFAPDPAGGRARPAHGRGARGKLRRVRLLGWRMRLQLGGLLLVAGAASADTSFISKVQVYTDSDHTTVISPVVEAQTDVTPTTTVNLGYLVDVVTSASVDIVTQASATTIHDTRHQVSAGVAQTLGDYGLRAGYSFSRENDYLSHTIDGSVTRDVDDKNTQLGLGYGVSFNTVGRADDVNFSRSMTNQHVAASITQVIGPHLIGQLTYELENESGYQASPYRFVPVGGLANPTYWVPETDPDSRTRNALVVGLNQAVGEGSIQGDFRIYHDTWGITSETIGARYYVKLSRATELRLRERFYTQNAASFYQSTYTSAQEFMAFDRELSPLWSETFGAKLMHALTPHLEGELKADLFYYNYSDFVPLKSRTGANLGIGVSVTY